MKGAVTTIFGLGIWPGLSAGSDPCVSLSLLSAGVGGSGFSCVSSCCSCCVAVAGSGITTGSSAAGSGAGSGISA